VVQVAGWREFEVLPLIAFLLITVLRVLAARSLALRKHRHTFGWMLATALFPPVILMLLALPRHEEAAHPTG